MSKSGFILHRRFAWLATWGFRTFCLEIKLHNIMLLWFSPGSCHIGSGLHSGNMHRITVLMLHGLTDFAIWNVKNTFSSLLCKAPLAGRGTRRKYVTSECPSLQYWISVEAQAHASAWRSNLVFTVVWWGGSCLPGMIPVHSALCMPDLVRAS